MIIEERRFFDDMIRLGTLIKSCRISNKLSRKQLANKAKVNEYFLQGIENGTFYPNIKDIYSLITALGHNPHNIILALIYALSVL